MNKLKDKIIKNIDSLATNLETILFGETNEPDLDKNTELNHSIIISPESLDPVTNLKKNKSADNLLELSVRKTINNVHAVRKKIFFLKNATSLSEIQNKNTISTCFQTSPITRSGIENISKIKGSFDLVIRSELPIAKETLIYSKITYKNIEETALCNELSLEDINDQNCKRIKEFKEFLYDHSRKYNTILVITHDLFIKYFFEKSTHSFIEPYKYLVLEEMDDKNIALCWPNELIWIGKCD